MQTILFGDGVHTKIGGILQQHGRRKALLVCDGAFSHLQIAPFFDTLPIPSVRFSGFTANPLLGDVCAGVGLLRAEECDAIIAVGGGSAIDVAKCLKLYYGMSDNRSYLEQEYHPNELLLIALPTTAGTGSESTRYAVVYENGEKQSVTNDAILPAYAILDPLVLTTLPRYQKICTMLDALCQGIESWWSVNANEESRDYSRKAVAMITAAADEYIAGERPAAQRMMMAANYAGRAIHITQTTAPHAMSYKLTSTYGIPHGHAVAVCLPPVWRYMMRGCVPPLESTFAEIAAAMGAGNAAAAVDWMDRLLERYEIAPPDIKPEDIPGLAAAVNPTRLGNNPVGLDYAAVTAIYKALIEKETSGFYERAKTGASEATIYAGELAEP